MLDFKLANQGEDARNMNIEMEKFIENTVEYIKKEKYTLWDLNILKQIYHSKINML